MSTVLPFQEPYPTHKLLVIVLLACNGLAFWFFGTFGDFLDSVAWLTLLLLFELETEWGQRLRASPIMAAVHILRILAIIGVGLAALIFLHDEAWLDAANSGLWFAVVFLLELEVRWTAAVRRFRRAFAALALALFAGLSLLVVLWAWNREYLDAYDALLWIVAFATIERDLLGKRDSVS